MARKLGEATRRRRLQRGETLEKVASRVPGLDVGALSRVERGQGGTRWSVSLWCDLARALGWTFAELIRAAHRIE